MLIKEIVTDNQPILVELRYDPNLVKNTEYKGVKFAWDKNVKLFKSAKTGQFIPKRQLVANICQWAYRSSECSYSGSNYFDINDNSVSTLAADRCGKRLSSCKKRFGENGELPFGSFPSAGRFK